jgi:cell shape-determining protein MreC
MSRLRFNHVFGALLATALASSLLMPPGRGGFVRGIADRAFAPLTVPTRQAAGWLTMKLSASDSSPTGQSGASAGQLREENEQLRTTIAQLSADLDRLRRLHAQFEQLGDAAQHCRQFAVLFADSGTRDGLSIKATSADGVEKGMAVVTPLEAVGKITAAGVGGAHVQLITDRESWMRVKFGRLETREGKRVFVIFRPERSPICQGVGNGRMQILNLHLRDVEAAQVREGDLVLPDDEGEWPAQLQGKALGRVDRIAAQRKAPLFAQIEVVPRVDLRQLAGVMVMVKR